MNQKNTATSPDLASSTATAPLEISVAEAKQWLDTTSEGEARPLLIDVREAHELVIACIGAARHIPLAQLPEQTATLPRERPLLLLCHHGGRSRRATEYLRGQGFARATNVAGGIDSWAQHIDTSLARY